MGYYEVELFQCKLQLIVNLHSHLKLQTHSQPSQSTSEPSTSSHFHQPKIEPQEQTLLSAKRQSDHDYLVLTPSAPTPKRKKAGEHEQYYKKTLDILEKINDNLTNINKNFEILANAAMALAKNSTTNK